MFKTHLHELRSILCIGAHADDLEIGCGATVRKLLAEHKSVHVVWLVLAGAGSRKEEASQSAQWFLGGAGTRKIIVRDYRDSFFPYVGSQIKDEFHALARQVSPDVIFTHRREDMHQDHRLVAELTWNAFRNHLIFEYEIPKYEGDLGTPNVFVPHDEPAFGAKVDAIVRHFPSQASKGWFSADLFWSVARLRGVECNAPSHLAEAFYCRKLTL